MACTRPFRHEQLQGGCEQDQVADRVGPQVNDGLGLNGHVKGVTSHHMRGVTRACFGAQMIRAQSVSSLPVRPGPVIGPGRRQTKGGRLNQRSAPGTRHRRDPDPLPAELASRHSALTYMGQERAKPPIPTCRRHLPRSSRCNRRRNHRRG